MITELSPRWRLCRLGALSVTAFVSGCAGVQAILDPAAIESARILDMFTLMFWVSGSMYALVLGFLLWAIVRRRGRRQDHLEAPQAASSEPKLRIAMGAWIALIALGLVTLTVGSYVVDQQLAYPSRGEPLRIEVTAQQWWWKVNYNDPLPSNQFETANELHLPVNRAVEITLRSSDVIHSFWIPNLAGKRDMIPDRVNTIRITPVQPGQYRGECAEFCGLQHAHMALDVTVESAERFEAWRAHQRQPAPPPSTPEQKAGHDYFVSRECALCHTINGTPANGQVAPNLTHLASRRSLAAGTIPNTRGHLRAWLADPQGIKPGNYMPYIGLEPNELTALGAYLEMLE